MIYMYQNILAYGLNPLKRQIPQKIVENNKEKSCGIQIDKQK